MARSPSHLLDSSGTHLAEAITLADQVAVLERDHRQQCWPAPCHPRDPVGQVIKGRSPDRAHARARQRLTGATS